jgi:ketosteroid isomerase-like protein
MGVRELIDSYNDAWNRQDLDAIHAAHAPGVVFHNHTADERVEGADAVRAHIERIFENWPTLRFTGRSLRVADDFAVSEWTARGEKDGRVLEWDGVDVFPIVDGKIARKDVYSTSFSPRIVSGTSPTD